MSVVSPPSSNGWTIPLKSGVESRVADPHHVDADPDPTYHFDTNPDPTFHFDEDPDPASHKMMISANT